MSEINDVQAIIKTTRISGELAREAQTLGIGLPADAKVTLRRHRVTGGLVLTRKWPTNGALEYEGRRAQFGLTRASFAPNGTPEGIAVDFYTSSDRLLGGLAVGSLNVTYDEITMVPRPTMPLGEDLTRASQEHPASLGYLKVAVDALCSPFATALRALEAGKITPDAQAALAQVTS